MSENDSSHIDMVADSVGFDMCQYSWVVRVKTKHKQWGGEAKMESVHTYLRFFTLPLGYHES